MEKLTICTWVWGTKYGPHYLAKLSAALRRNVEQPFEFVVFSPQPQDAHLIDKPGCFARLRMFDPEWQKAIGLEGRLVCLDLDLVITGPLDELFDRPEPFVILQGANASNPCPFNGSVMMLRAGAHPEVWSDFNVNEARRIPFFEYPDDQGWLAHKVPDAAGWKAGPESGVYAFQKPGWPARSEALPKDARIVAFPGWRDPHLFTHLDWVRRHWRA